MKALQYAYRRALGEIALGIDDLLADLEDIRDEAQDCLEENGDESIRQDIARMDAALQTLMNAADMLENMEEE